MLSNVFNCWIRNLLHECEDFGFSTGAKGTRNRNFAVDADHIDHDDVVLGAAATRSHFIRKLQFNSFPRELESYVASYCTTSVAHLGRHLSRTCRVKDSTANGMSDACWNRRDVRRTPSTHVHSAAVQSCWAGVLWGENRGAFFICRDRACDRAEPRWWTTNRELKHERTGMRCKSTVPSISLCSKRGARKWTI